MKSKPIALIVVAAAMLTSCAGDDVLAELSEPKEILFSVSEASSETRAGITTKNIENFGISITNPVSSNYTYNNVKVERSAADDKWTPADQLLWHNLNDTVDIVAMSPYSSKVGNLCGVSNYAVSVKENQMTTGLEESDFLVWKATAFVPKRDLNSDGTLGIEFKHAMCKLDIYVTHAENKEVDYVKVCGAKRQGQCDFTADVPVVTACGDTKRDLKAQTETTGTAGTTVAHCIMIPQTTESSFQVILYLKQGGAYEKYIWKPSQSLTLESGKTYTIYLSTD